ncbi:hypothetical protein TH53_17930 [Pedobacter lusitanus]|uniref:Tail fiber protein n=1 Tax=Pedobacter lusitanus TaxID=1503925 RepID=A0A0D0GNB6_9SPHI|nr:hypothetical protein [Pedobacter lusitanus]KIO75941.1 hypothetical protein TH53_17930 [Pedobacter lusitanus]
MNNINFEQTGGFPLETDTLNFMQASYTSLQSVTALGGSNYILSGCTVSGSTVTDGYVVLNGELLPFRGGLVQTNIVIREDKQQRPFENGQTKDVFFTRYAQFGTGTGAINWGTLPRLMDLQTVGAEIAKKALSVDLAALRNEVDTLKKIAAPFSGGGGMVLFKKPFNQIPLGWAEVAEWRGRLPMGWNPDDYRFSSVGQNGGAASHSLNESQLPILSNDRAGLQRQSYWGENVTSKNTDDRDSGKEPDILNHIGWPGTGAQIDHLNPYRIVMFIEYVGG